MTDTPRTNALAAERSPYLLQHAHNPVDWLPWGDEAFERARALDRPVFLSVGYSACHWCHVMERESFEDPETAAILNEGFVSIKVDREERPDVDQVYQLAYQALTQRGGGWPLSMFLTPDRQPFTGGTYFPNARRYGMPSFREVLVSVHDAWTGQRDDLVGQALELTDLLARITRPEASKIRPEAVDREALSEACALLLRRADRAHGGFGAQPKFPNTMALDLLAAHAVFNPDAPSASDAKSFLNTTLTEMSRGGIYDHLGGGFARYSTDRVWRVPHFEKMLYDNAQLARLYVDGWRLFGDEPFARVARSVFTYVAREMTSAHGCFYSAQDADSEGEEGRFFAWTPPQITAVVGDDAPAVCAWFDVTPEGNFEHGKSVLWTPRSRDEVSASLKLTPDALDAVVDRARPKLWEAREARVHPNLDDKCLASWNGQMISALADAGATRAEPTWVDAAERALDAWQTRAFSEGRVAHAIKHETSYGQGFLDDHAALCLAAIDVWEATFSARALGFARALGESILARFVDDATGEFFFSPHDGEVVLHRNRDPHDHAYPGGTGMACDALLRLSALTGDMRFHAAAGRCVSRFAAAARENPMAMSTVLRALDRLARGSVEIVVMGEFTHPSTQSALASARSVLVPHRVIVCARTAEEAMAAGVDAALVRDRRAGDGGEAVVYVCRNGVCSLPVRAPAEVVAALRDAVRG